MNEFDAKTLVQITNSENDINKDYDIDHAILGDVDLVLEQLLSEIKYLISENKENKPY